MTRNLTLGRWLYAGCTTLAIAAAMAWMQPATTTAAGAEDSQGTDFWLMFNQNHTGGPQLTLFITSGVNTNGTVTVPGIAFSQNFSVTANIVTSVSLPASAMHSGSNTTQNLGVHVVANDEVTVYGLNRIVNTTDAFLGLPTDILGTEYLVMSHENGASHNGTEFGVVATQNGTTVTITPTVTTSGRTAGVPYNINLNQGQTYQLINLGLSGEDLTGTLITSTAPIGVFSGAQCANVPSSNVFACDHLVEQMPPTSTWGKSFVTIPLATRIGGDTFRFLAQTNGTTVSVNGVNVAVLNRGQFHERLINGPARIVSSEPILVAQFSNGTTFDNVTSDPFMMLIPPFEQFLADYTISTPASGFSINYVNIVAPTSAVGSVTLDGVVIPAGQFTPIPGTTFSGTQRPLALGSHHVSSPQPIGVFTYGFDSADSYGYPGGLALGQVASVTSIDLTPPSATNPVGTEHCVTATVRDQNGAPLSGIRVDFTVSGANVTAGFDFTDANGEAVVCYTGVNPGSDTITGAIGGLTDTASKTWVATAGVVCDVDGDEDVDATDLAAIQAGRGRALNGPNDPRDANRDGQINVADYRFCALRLTPPPPPPPAPSAATTKKAAKKAKGK